MSLGWRDCLLPEPEISATATDLDLISYPQRILDSRMRLGVRIPAIADSRPESDSMTPHGSGAIPPDGDDRPFSVPLGGQAAVRHHVAMAPKRF